VVHSGPIEELRQLIAIAREGMAPGDDLAAITPWVAHETGCPCFEYYPAANIVECAARVISGAGYNIIADMMYRRGRHIAIPFPRRYDDQHGRLSSLLESPRDGTSEAAEAIARLL
jgi:predicted glycosyltransferase